MADQAGKGDRHGWRGRRRTVIRVAEIAVLLCAGVFLFLALADESDESAPIRDHMVQHATEETGALNLVTAIYLGYRTFDTFGETIVLLLAVSGVVLFTGRDP